MLAFCVFTGLVALILLGVPIAVAIAATAIVGYALLGETQALTMLAQRMYASATGFTLLAIPFFILAGLLMNTGGVTDRIFRFAHALVGHFTGQASPAVRLPGDGHAVEPVGPLRRQIALDQDFVLRGCHWQSPGVTVGFVVRLFCPQCSRLAG